MMTDAQSPRFTSLAPQFLVADLERSVAWYQDKLDFEFDEPFEGFYAIGHRDGLELHLKCAEPNPSDRQYRQANSHLDASVGVESVDVLYAKFQSRGVKIVKPLQPTSWGTHDFYVEDLDGYILCFGGTRSDAVRATEAVSILNRFTLSVPVLHVSSVAEAENFYCRGLGFEIAFKYRPDGVRADPCYIGLQKDTAFLHVSSFSGDAVVGGVVYLLVENLDALHTTLVENDIAINLEPTDQSWGNREMYVKDPDGNSIRFVQES